MKLLKIQFMVYCLWSTAAIISTEGIKKKRVLKYFNFFFSKNEGSGRERERERKALETIFILAEFLLLA